MLISLHSLEQKKRESEPYNLASVANQLITEKLGDNFHPSGVEVHLNWKV